MRSNGNINWYVGPSINDLLVQDNIFLVATIGFLWEKVYCSREGNGMNPFAFLFMFSTFTLAVLYASQNYTVVLKLSYLKTDSCIVKLDWVYIWYVAMNKG